MFHIFLLLSLIVISCQQKKRGVACDRVDASSGQCIKQLSKATANTPPPPEILPPITLPPTKTAEEKDKTLLKDIEMSSKCLYGNCWPWDRENPDTTKQDVNLLCKVEDCSNDNLVQLGIEGNNPLRDKANLCGEGDKYIADGSIFLTCGIGYVNDNEFLSSSTPIKITNELINKGACIQHNSYTLPPDKEEVIINQKPDNGCTNPDTVRGQRYTSKVIELTFSLSL